MPVLLKKTQVARAAATQVALPKPAEVSPTPAKTVAAGASAVTLAQILRSWWPITLSWLMMIAEGPMVAALLARLPEPTLNLAAYGGIVRPLTFAIESPLLVLLTASATLCKNWETYQKVRKYAIWYIAICTAIHVVIAITPVYYWVTGRLIDAPQQIIEPARIGMIITIPYLALVAYRRLNHGVLIRFRHSYSIMIGTLIRLVLVLAVMIFGPSFKLGASGVFLGALTMTGGVLIEALFIEWRFRPVCRNELKKAPAPEAAERINHSQFMKFYLPLASTTVAMFLIHPVISAALSRMPNPVLSLAIWSPVVGLAGMLAAGGGPLVDVMVTVLDRPRSLARIRQFTLMVAAVTALLALSLVLSPLGKVWFGSVSALAGSLLTVAQTSFWFALPYPIFLVFQSYYQGILTYKHRTNRITEAVFLNTLTMVVFLILGTLWGKTEGIYVATTALSVGMILQTFWLWWRSQKWLHLLEEEVQGKVAR
ncbi:MAG: hypothetical protein OXF22_04820 [Anaerolineaceae bacterium]|nr:hypothetical protein [Anaerolineaceae bacterium]